MTTATIENKDGKLVSLTGMDAVEAFRLRVIISGIKLEQIGMKLSCGVSCTKQAQEMIQQMTGIKYKRTQRDEMIEVMKLICDAQIAKCDVISIKSPN